MGVARAWGAATGASSLSFHKKPPWKNIMEQRTPDRSGKPGHRNKHPKSVSKWILMGFTVYGLFSIAHHQGFFVL